VNCFSATTGFLHLHQFSVSTKLWRQTESRLLFAFVLVSPLEHVDVREFLKSILKTINIVDVDAQVEYAVEGVTVVPTVATFDTRAESSTKDLMYPTRLGDLRV
jgi:hypothetical protein